MFFLLVFFHALCKLCKVFLWSLFREYSGELNDLLVCGYCLEREGRELAFEKDAVIQEQLGYLSPPTVLRSLTKGVS